MYFDANIFIYLSDSKTTYHQDCLHLIEFCSNNKLSISTSAATLQEIIHWSRKIKNHKQGVTIAKDTLSLISDLHSITQATVTLFLKYANKYQLNGGQDLLHFASCIEHNHSDIITYDSAFKNFTEIRSFTPQEYIQAFS